MCRPLKVTLGQAHVCGAYATAFASGNIEDKFQHDHGWVVERTRRMG
jgi:hypothetical protein